MDIAAIVTIVVPVVTVLGALGAMYGSLRGEIRDLRSDMNDRFMAQDTDTNDRFMAQDRSMKEGFMAQSRDLAGLAERIARIEGHLLGIEEPIRAGPN